MHVKRLMFWTELIAPLVIALMLLSVQPVKAVDEAAGEVLRLSEIEHPHTSVDLLTQEPVPTPAEQSPGSDIVPAPEVVQVTEVKANPDANTIRVTVTGEAGVPTVELFDSPEEGLIFGVASAADVKPQGQPPQTPTLPRAEPGSEIQPDKPSAEGEELEILVTGEQEEGYSVPNASTATRTDTPLRDIPQSIQVIPQQVLEDQQIIRVDDALRNVSGVVGNFAQFGNSEALTIRGFLTDSYSNTPILRDGFRTYDNINVQETANLERIEVLKGPASVLYGQNDPGGLINLVTKQPLSTPFYNLQVQVGSFGLVRPTLDFSGPLSSDGRVLYRINAAYQWETGFRNFETATDRYFVAPVLQWKINDHTSLSFNFEHVRNESPYDPGLIAFGTGVIDRPYDQVFNEPDDYIRTRTLTFGYNFEHRFSDNWTVRNAFRYNDQDYQNLATIPISFDESTGILDRVYADRQYTSQDYSLQTNVVGELATGFINHTLLAGVDLNWFSNEDVYSNADFSNFIPLDVFNPVYRVVPRPDLTIDPGPFDIEVSRIGAYVQDQLALGDNFILVLGIRFDGIDNRNTFDGSTQYDSAWSPRVGLVYKPTETLSLYGSYSRSFTPNFDQDANGDFLQPQTAEGFEVGVKAELLNKKLSATLAYFDITKQNVATADPVIPFVSVSIGEQHSRGIEFDVTGQILPGWDVIGFYAYTDAEVTEDNTIPVGNRLPGAPKHSVGLWTTYEIQAGGLRGLGLGVGVNYVGNRFGDLENSYEVGDYFVTNAAIFYERDQWRVGLNFRNLFDTRYISSAGGNNSRNIGIAPGTPFSVVGTILVEF